jgi:Prenyltransferase and squalene oxidase repeat
LSHPETGIAHIPGEVAHSGDGGSLASQSVQFMLEAQNPDGGWGFQAALGSATEPTAWAAAALAAIDAEPLCARPRERGLAWLLACQLQDGSWPARPGQRDGCWVTSAACLALAARRDGDTAKRHEAVRKGLAWLTRLRPGTRNHRWWAAGIGALGHRESQRRTDLEGWSWTPGTSSWIEPTAQALVALQNAPREFWPRGAARRMLAAQAMLLDGALMAGGWNSGGAESYGYAGRPQAIPTAWALMALRDQGQRPEVETSLEWLRRNHTKFTGLFSLGLACCCLRLWGISCEVGRLERLFLNGIAPVSVMEAAWTLLASAPAPEITREPGRNLKP